MTAHRSSVCYAGLVGAQSLTLAAYVVVTVGAALLQKKANTLTLFNDPAQVEANTALYNEVFQSTQYIVPYPQQPQYQWQYQWWVIELELFVFLWTAAITLFPALIPRVRPVALTFIAAALVLVMDNINALYFLLRNDTAMAVFDDYRIKMTQAGLIMVGVANGLTIIFLGLYQPDSRTHDNNAKVPMNANAV
jgi:hypothetical protein